MFIYTKIRRFLKKGKNADYIAKTLGISKKYVYKIRREDAKLGKPKITRKELLNEINPGLDALFGLEYKKPDLVNHPPHYKAGGIEVIDFIEAKDLNFRLGNAVKYISRAGKKATDPVQDLEKAAWYLKREIDARKGA